jgi:hypothetical protein
VGLVQARWGHLNRDLSPLTRAQGLAIDGHFSVEQAGRCWSGWMLNFNGTAGMWRKTAIEDAGGWQADTLTEDLDLSYRAQLRGWKVEYAVDVEVPAEIPADIAAFKSQQRRWAKGSIQTAKKLLPRVLRAPLPRVVRLQAALHLTHYFVHPLMVWWPSRGADARPGNLHARLGSVLFGHDGRHLRAISHVTSQKACAARRRMPELPLLMVMVRHRREQHARDRALLGSTAPSCAQAQPHRHPPLAQLATAAWSWPSGRGRAGLLVHRGAGSPGGAQVGPSCVYAGPCYGWVRCCATRPHRGPTRGSGCLSARCCARGGLATAEAGRGGWRPPVA